MLVNGEYPSPFSMRTYDLRQLKPNPNVGELIKNLSRIRYGRDKDVVEADISSRSNPRLKQSFASAKDLGYNLAQR